MMKQITMTLELAKEMYNSNNEQLKKLALETFPEVDETKIFKELFLDMWFGCTLHRDIEYPNSVFLMKNGEVWFEQDFKNGCLHCRYDKVWKIFEDKFGYNHNKIRDLINDIVVEHFKLSGIVPIWFDANHGLIGGKTLQIEGNCTYLS